MLTRAQKQAEIEALKGSLSPAQGLFVMDFTGLTVAEATELRRRVREANGNYRVVKNTLAKLAVADTPNQALQQLLVGSAAVAFTVGDSVALAKALAEFSKSHEKLRFRGGVVEGQLLDAQQAKQIATLPTKQELVAKLLYLLQSPMRRLVAALSWPTRSLAVTLKQVADGKETSAQAPENE